MEKILVSSLLFISLDLICRQIQNVAILTSKNSLRPSIMCIIAQRLPYRLSGRTELVPAAEIRDRKTGLVSRPFSWFQSRQIFQVIPCQKQLFLHQLTQNMIVCWIKSSVEENYMFKTVCVHQIVINVKETFWCTEFCPQIWDNLMQE